MIILALHHLRKATLFTVTLWYKKDHILNRQFTSVLTDDTKTSLPDLGTSPYQTMEDIIASCEDVVKPLKNLRPHKATGPDDIPPVITLLFQAI